jgi:thymidylate synthase (FAD)
MNDFDKLMEMKNEPMAEQIAVIDDDNPQKAWLLDHGEVELLQYMGDKRAAELNIVNAARQSFGQSSQSMGESENGLVNFLMRERHGTPFEMIQFLFQVKCPIFVAREWMRHRMGSFNEYSGRYTKMMQEYYVPALPQMRQQVGKPGSYTMTPLRNQDKAGRLRHVMDGIMRDCWVKYETLLEAGIAKEVARMVLPVSMYTQFTWSVNTRSLLNFISLRSDDQAMYEIRAYSKTIEGLIRPIIPRTMECFDEHDRMTP